jgi:hypothetical protein
VPTLNVRLGSASTDPVDAQAAAEAAEKAAKAAEAKVTAMVSQIKVRKKAVQHKHSAVCGTFSIPCNT